MIRAAEVRSQLHWRDAPADTIVLDFDDRHRRRMVMTSTRGLQFLLDLEKATVLRGGDALVLDDGRMVEVLAAPEPLLEIRCADAAHLGRMAWHLGNRHLPMQVAGAALRIRRDHVIEAMVKKLGGRVIEIESAFDPEGGAYDEAVPVHAGHDHTAHGHTAHGHDHGHHGQPHVHDHTPHAHASRD